MRIFMFFRSRTFSFFRMFTPAFRYNLFLQKRIFTAIGAILEVLYYLEIYSLTQFFNQCFQIQLNLFTCLNIFESKTRTRNLLNHKRNPTTLSMLELFVNLSRIR